MNSKSTLALALAAGFAGGLISQHTVPLLAHAQATTPAPLELRAERFVLVDSNGVPRGAFGIDKKGWPTIEITDKKGRPLSVEWAYFFRGSHRSIVPQK